LKGTTFDDVLDPLFVGGTMTRVAVIVSTRTVLAFGTGAHRRPISRRFVFRGRRLLDTHLLPVEVNGVKPAVDTLLTLRTDAPAGGPDRALAPPPPDPKRQRRRGVALDLGAAFATARVRFRCERGVPGGDPLRGRLARIRSDRL
jgi:hypothetical protein